MLKKCLVALLLIGSGFATTSKAGSDVEYMKRRFPNRAIYMPYVLATRTHTAVARSSRAILVAPLKLIRILLGIKHA